MRILIALTLLLAGVAAFDYGRTDRPGYGKGGRGGYDDGGYGKGGRGGYDNGGYGKGSGPGYGKKGGFFSFKDMEAAEDFLHKVANEKEFVREQADMIKASKLELLDKLQKLRSITFPKVERNQQDQNAALEAIRQKIKDQLHDFGEISSRLEGERAVAERNERQVSSLSARIDELVHSNNKQDGTIQKAITALNKAYEKSVEKLNITREKALDRVVELKTNAIAFAGLTNTRRCASSFARVVIDGTKNFGEAYAQYTTDFSGNTPTVTCALQGFQSKVNLDKSEPVNAYGGYPTYADRRKVLAIVVDCKAFPDKALVRVSDQSLGTGNRFQEAYVVIKACTLGAQAGVPKQ